MEIDKKRLSAGYKKAQKHGLKYKELAKLFSVAPSIVHKWAAAPGGCHVSRQPQFDAFYAWLDADCPGITEWRLSRYSQELNPAKITPVTIHGPHGPRGNVHKAKPVKKISTTTEALTTVVDSLELDLEEFLHSEQKLRAQHALEFAATKVGIALPKATRFAVLLVAGLQSGGVLQNKDFSALLKG